MKTNYVYFVIKTKTVCADLNTAIQNAYEDMKASIIGRHSKPYTVKVVNGYKVIVTDIYGTVYSRQIDVFSPLKEKTTRKYLKDSSNQGRIKRKLIGYCYYCGEPIYEGDNYLHGEGNEYENLFCREECRHFACD